MNCPKCNHVFASKNYEDPFYLQELQVGISYFARNEGPSVVPSTKECNITKRTIAESIKFIQGLRDADGEDILDNLETVTVPLFTFECNHCYYDMFAEELGLLPWRNIEEGFQVAVTTHTDLGDVTVQANIIPSEEMINKYNERKALQNKES